MTESKKIELVKTHLKVHITHDANQWDNVDLKVYTESTADGYEVFIITSDDNPIITEDVHYYDSELASSVLDSIDNFEQSEDNEGIPMLIYMEDDLYEDCYMDDELMSWLEDNVSDVIDNAENLELTEDEVIYLKETY